MPHPNTRRSLPIHPRFMTVRFHSGTSLMDTKAITSAYPSAMFLAMFGAPNK
jgi:hypothetical protein